MSSASSRRSLDYSLALQFAIIVVPLAALFLYQAASDVYNAELVTFETESVTLAQKAYGSYKSFLDGAADAADTGSLSGRGYQALERSRTALHELQSLDRASPVRALVERVDTLLLALQTDRSLEALLAVRPTANQADRLFGELVEFHRVRGREHIQRIANESTRQVWTACATLVVAIGLLFLVVRRLSRPLYRAVSVASAIARGDFGEPAREGAERDVGGLLASLEAMRTNLKRAFDELAQKEKRLSHAQEIGRIGDWMIEVWSGRVSRSYEACAILGLQTTEAAETHVVPPALVHVEDRELVDESFWAAQRAGKNFKIDFRIVLPSGEMRFLSAQSETRFDAGGRVAAVLGVLQDMTARKSAELHAERLALHDHLTGLPNRTLFLRILAHAMTQAQRRNDRLCVLLLDIDRFQRVNDGLGHETGDALLREFAQRLKNGLRKTDTVARLAGDEFAVLAEGIDDVRRVSALGRTVRAVVEQPFFVLGQEFHLTATIGMSIFPKDARDEHTLVKHAEVAMYRAKEAGRDSVHFYSPELNADQQERRAVEARLHRALERDEFVVYYQPRLALRGGQITGVEALLRWQQPGTGILPPAKFVSIAEESGLIVPIGKWLLRAACEQSIAWQREGLPRLRICVNLSAAQFANPELAQDIAALVRQSGIDADLLELEIAEATLARDVEASARILATFAGTGVHLAMDNVGTGRLPLDALKRLPLSSLKIDRSCVRELPGRQGEQAIVEAVIAVGRTLRMKVVAAGVERKDQLDYLEVRGCDEMQGYFFSEPLPADECAALLRQARTAPGVLRRLSQSVDRT